MMLTPSGDNAAHIARLFMTFLAISGGVYGLVMIVALASASRGAVRKSEPSTNDRRALRLVALGSVLTIATLVVMLVFSYRTGHAIASAKTATVNVQVTAYQWWWRFDVLADPPSDTVVTANELHIPVGESVRFDLSTRDVIHSFWVPELGGKRDIIPGQTSSLVLSASRPGVYRGRCSEFCGLQHTHMELVIIAEPRADYEAWLAGQRATAHTPETPDQERGQHVFASGACPMCHAVSGTNAFGANGPNLSHVASRSTLAAGALPNNRGGLAGWIIDPQHTKPGARMPPQPMPADDLNALVAYLESLQ